MKTKATQLPLVSRPDWANQLWDEAERAAWGGCEIVSLQAQVRNLTEQLKQVEARENQRDLLVEKHAEQIRALMAQFILRRHNRADDELRIRNATDDWSAAADFSLVRGPDEIELRFGGSDQRQIIEAAWTSIDTGEWFEFKTLSEVLKKPELRPRKCFRVKRPRCRATVHPAVAMGFIKFRRGALRLCKVGARPLARPLVKK